MGPYFLSEKQNTKASPDRNCWSSAHPGKENDPSEGWGCFGSRATAGAHPLIPGQTPHQQLQEGVAVPNEESIAAFQAEHPINGKTFCSRKTQ